ncbi:hypothetical protein PA598K_01553 [Paenibacillus sp. 598K]|uniref:DUF695 domain-containing protein n=1 Tax=Paenibacillus sp. 598K TaxID=1117987 RepID=UPI000FF92948|nr:DUF695 domain-containing protein [Paenibacillus sp. 598K]GBF73268.1 hypothetical protein PA598K_01553 [Paenibacillus sp. 598K]
MADNWGFFERRTEQEQMRILVNMGWRQQKRPEGHSELLSATINLMQLMKEQKDRRNAVQALERLESRLEEALGAALQTVYIGRINTAKRLEFYYYAPPDEEMEAKQRELRLLFRDDRIVFYSKPDPDWTFYRFLMPSELEEMYIHNAQMVYALIHKGDHIERPRQVYHWLMFRQDEDRAEMKQAVEHMGYKVEDGKVPEERPEYPYSLVISRWEDVRLETVNERVGELYKLVDTVDGRYDGWGAVLRLSWLKRIRLGASRRIGAIQTLRRWLGRSEERS